MKVNVAVQLFGALGLLVSLEGAALANEGTEQGLPSGANPQSPSAPSLPASRPGGGVQVQAPAAAPPTAPVVASAHPMSPPSSTIPEAPQPQTPRAAAQEAAPSAPGAAVPGEPIDPYSPTSSKAPDSQYAPASPQPSPATAAPVAIGPMVPPPEAPRPAGEPTIKKEAPKKSKKDKFKHKGFITEARAGVLGCFGTVCSNNHGMDPGVQVGGFLGGNLFGFLELGIQGGWGKLNPHVVENSNMLSLYGIDARTLEDEIQVQMNLPPELDLDLAALNVQSAASNAAHGGFALRLHVIPRGRVAAYVGTGFNYQLYRSEYGTPLGDVRMDFHGFSVPIQGGLGVYVHKRIAFTGQFDYLWTRYLVANLDHPLQRILAPVQLLETSSEAVSSDFSKNLPAFWTATAAIRITL